MWISLAFLDKTYQNIIDIVEFNLPTLYKEIVSGFMRNIAFLCFCKVFFRFYC